MLSMAMGGDFKTGAMAAGASEALANILADSTLKGDTEQLKRMQQAAAQIVGIAAANAVDGDLQMGGEIAKSGMAYNRQLHPTEQELAKSLAEKSDGRFTQEEIEAAMRISSIDGTGITAATDMIAALPGVYDAGGNWIPLGDSGLYVQDFEKANPDVIAYIKENINIYSWTSEAETGFSRTFPNSGLGVGLESEQRDWLTGSVIGSDSKYVTGSVIDGQVYYPVRNSCADLMCMIYGAGLDTSAASSKAYLDALLVKNIQDLGYGAATGAMFSPVGVGGQIFTLTGMSSTMAAFYLKGEPMNGAYSIGEDVLINAGLSKAFGEALGSQIGSAITVFDLKQKIKDSIAGGERD